MSGRRPVMVTGRGRPAFSLAELMIALVILGLGLLFIATALPVGVEYARRNVERADAQDAADVASQTLEGALRTSDGLLLRSTAFPGTATARLDALVRPRYFDPGSNTIKANDLYEPVIKVRPVVMRNVNATRGTIERGAVVSDPTEGAIYNFVGISGTTSAWSPPEYSLFVPQTFADEIGRAWGRQPGELDPYRTKLGGAPTFYINTPFAANEVDGGFGAGPIAFNALMGTPLNAAVNAFPIGHHPVVGVFSRFFPAIQPVTRYAVDDFFANRRNYRYGEARTINRNYQSSQPGAPAAPPGVPGGLGPYWANQWNSVYDAEAEQAFDRTIAWTAFYRRVSYMEWRVITPTGGVLPANAWYADEVYPVFESNDPTLCELIVVVARRPTVNHRYPLQAGQSEQSVSGLDMLQEPEALDPRSGGVTEVYGADRLAPTPWLVAMTELPTLQLGVDYSVDPLTGTRALNADFRDRPTLVFHCEPEVARVCPPGSVMIPARNDYRPSGLETGPVQQAGFVPSAADTLPIYRVIERREPAAAAGNRNQDWQLIVEGNGYYPWVGVGPNAGDPRALAGALPFWIVPPAFEERDGGGVPLYEDESPVLTVERRIVRIPKAPDTFTP